MWPLGLNAKEKYALARAFDSAVGTLKKQEFTAQSLLQSLVFVLMLHFFAFLGGAVIFLFFRAWLLGTGLVLGAVIVGYLSGRVGNDQEAGHLTDEQIFKKGMDPAFRTDVVLSIILLIHWNVKWYYALPLGWIVAYALFYGSIRLVVFAILKWTARTLANPH